MDVLNKALEIHAQNVKAGWWPENRNRPECLMLVVSEVAEAATGYWDNLPDDKLPDHPMLDVEIADVAIRLYDLCGIDAGHVDPVWAGRCHIIGEQLTGGIDTDLLQIVVCVSGAMEHHRKGRLDDYAESLWDALAMVYEFADEYQIALDEIVALKREFNRTRADHQIENRALVGGKAY